MTNGCIPGSLGGIATPDPAITFARQLSCVEFCCQSSSYEARRRHVVAFYPPQHTPKTYAPRDLRNSFETAAGFASPDAAVQKAAAASYHLIATAVRSLPASNAISVADTNDPTTRLHPVVNAPPGETGSQATLGPLLRPRSWAPAGPAAHATWSPSLGPKKIPARKKLPQRETPNR